MEQIWKAKNNLQQNIRRTQTKLDFNASRYKKDINNDSTFRSRNVKFAEEELSEGKKLASIQKDQIQLKNLDKETDLLNSRILEEENLNHNEKNFPYGVENIEVKEDVLNRYRGRNYMDQSRMIEKFRIQAEEAKKRKKKIQKPMYVAPPTTYREVRRIEPPRRRKQNIEQNSHKVNEIVDIMKKVSKQINNNSYHLDRQLEDLRRRIERNKQKKEKERKRIVFPPIKIDYSDFDERMKKVPVVVYQGKKQDARIYFSEVHKTIPQVNYSPVHTQNDYSYKDFVSILQANNQRLQELRKQQYN